VCACCLIRTWCDPDEDVEGGPAAKGNFVLPSPTLPSSSEAAAAAAAAAEEEADKAMGGQAPAGGKLEAGMEGSQGAKAEEPGTLKSLAVHRLYPTAGSGSCTDGIPGKILNYIGERACLVTLSSISMATEVVNSSRGKHPG